MSAGFFCAVVKTNHHQGRAAMLRCYAALLLFALVGRAAAVRAAAMLRCWLWLFREKSKGKIITS